MKLLTFLIFAGSMTLSASSYSQKTKIDLHLQNLSLADIFSSIEKSSEFIFFYNDEVVNDQIKKSVSADGVQIENILEDLFKGTNITFKVDDRQVFLYKKDDIKSFESLVSSTLMQQPQKKDLSGTVKDTKGLPLPGVTVMVKGTTLGIITDNEGSFGLSVPVNAKTLVFSFVGMKTQEFAIAGKTVFNVVLEEEIVAIDDVVVVGYGVQKKASVVAAISQISSADIMKVGKASDLSRTLTGLLPGLTTMENTNSQPGSEKAQILIRSNTSWNSSAPLILVDGVERSMDDINTEDVETVSILKDASATAVYGVGGANGVILITTKRGTKGKIQLDVSANSTMKWLSKLPKTLNSYEGNLMKNQAIENEVAMNPASWNNFVPEEVLNHYQNHDMPYLFPDIDWQNYVMGDGQPAMSHRATFSVKGGDTFVKYYGSVSYVHEGDLIQIPTVDRGYGNPAYSYDRFNVRTNLDFSLTKTTTFSANFSGFRGTAKQPVGGDNKKLINMAAVSAPDYLVVQYEDGNFGYNPSITAAQNPYVNYNYLGIRRNNATNFTSDFLLKQDLNFITEGLSFNAKLSYDNTITTTGVNVNDVGDNGVSKYIDGIKYLTSTKLTEAEKLAEATTWKALSGQFTPVSPSVLPTLPGVSKETYNNLFYKFLTYQFNFDWARTFGAHDLSAMAVMKRQESGNGSDFLSYKEDWVGRVTYGYDNKYLAEVNMAYDGSEKFGPGYRFGFFPSLALGWMFSNEKFVKKIVPFLSRGKLRYSNGSVGSDINIARWLYNSQWAKGSGLKYPNVAPELFGAELGYPSIATAPYIFNRQTVIGNPEAHWETAHKQNVGLETSFFYGMLSFNADYYWESRYGILMSASQRRSLPSWFGTAAPSLNLGKTEGSGLELELRFKKRTKYGINYSVSANWTVNYSKIIFADDPALNSDYMNLEGFRLGQTKEIITNGFYNSWDDVYTNVVVDTYKNIIPGNFKMIDFNSDGVINNKDKAPYGYSTIPQNTANLALEAGYKGLSIMIQFYSSYNVNTPRTGAKSAMDFTEFPSANSSATIVRDFHRDIAWTPERATLGTASYSALLYKVQNTYQNSYFITDMSYLRLKNVELSYTFNNKLVSKLGMSKFRLFISGANLFVWNHTLYDAELGFFDPAIGIGYPTSKRVTFGADFSF